MKGWLTLFLAAAVAGRGEAQNRPWTAVLSTADSTDWIDTTTIRTPGPDLIEVWGKRQYTLPIRSRGDIYDVLLTRWRIRCAVPSAMVLEEARYKGEVLVGRNSNGVSRATWSSPGIDPFTDAVVAKACVLAQGRGRAPAPAMFEAQADTGRVVLSGTVVDAQANPIEGVEVRLVGDTVRRFTSATGTFRLLAPGSKELLLQFRRPGYNAQLLTLTGAWDGTVQMVPGAFELPPIQVNAANAKPIAYASTTKYDDFFRRRHQGIGQFITREEIDRRNALHTPEILEGHAGIRIDVQTGRGTSVAFARCNEYPPKINVYVDGHKLIPNGGPISYGTADPRARIMRRDPEVTGITGEMLGRVDPRSIELIEVFRGASELPPEFNDGNCGAIVIWTREGPR